MSGVQNKHSQLDPLFLFVTDLHFTTKKPKWRVGDYTNHLLEKLRNVGRIAKSEKVEFVVIGGDLTNDPIVSLQLGDLIVDEIESWGVPVHVVVGNHDLFGNSLATLDSTWLGHVFRRSSVIKKLDKLYIDDLCIWGVHFDTGIEEVLASKDHYGDSVDCKFKYTKIFDTDGNQVDFKTERIAQRMVEITHAMVSPTGMHPNARQIKPDDYQTCADLVLSGDYHEGWTKPFRRRRDFTIFVNPGAMARQARSKSDCGRTVQVAIINRDLSTKFVPLESALSKEEVFDIDAAEKIDRREARLDNFSEKIKKNKKIPKVDVRARIEEICSEENVDNAIREKTLTYYDKFREGEME